MGRKESNQTNRKQNKSYVTFCIMLSCLCTLAICRLGYYLQTVMTRMKCHRMQRFTGSCTVCSDKIDIKRKNYTIFVEIYLFIYLFFIQYLNRCTLLAEIAILPSGPQYKYSMWPLDIFNWSMRGFRNFRRGGGGGGPGQSDVKSSDNVFFLFFFIFL